MRRTESKRILFATIGSLGDLHPCLALGLELKRRGHSVAIACAEFYRKKIEAHDILFRPMRPNWKPNDQELIRQCETLRTGPEVLFRRLILPHLKDTYQDLLFAARDTDLMISGELAYAAPLVAEKLRLNWVSVILSPSSFFSSRDPSELVTVPGLMLLRKAGWPVYRAGLNICRLATNHWSRPVRQLRRELGLRRDCDPVFRDKFLRSSCLHFFRAGWRNSNPIGLSKQSNLVLFIMIANSLTETCRPNCKIFYVLEFPLLCLRWARRPYIIRKASTLQASRRQGSWAAARCWWAYPEPPVSSRRASLGCRMRLIRRYSLDRQ